MSKPIRFDSLLIRDLADELNATLADSPLRAVRFDRDALVLELLTDTARWNWALHPTRGALLRLDAAKLDGNVMLPRRARIAAVSALPDERVLVIAIRGDAADAQGGTAQRILVELLTNQWNALALGHDDRIVHVLRPRTTAARTLHTGEIYAAPAPTGRAGVDAPLPLDAWITHIGAATAGTRMRAFTAGVAYASPLNAPFVIGTADAHDDALPAAHTRYLALLAGPRTPCVLPAPLAGQPYSVLLDPAARAFSSLVDAFAAAAGPLSLETDDAARAAALDHATLQTRRAHDRVRRLRAQLDAAPADAAALRRSADLLLAQMHRVPKGATHVVLDDFEGGTLSVELDATRSAADNASHFYAQAKKRDRAARRLPTLIAQAEREAAEWQTLCDRLGSDDVSNADIAAAQPAPAQGSRRARREVSLPYRVYRTTGGLEVRVGRGAKGNDALTLRHSHGNDIWLHARDVGGAHVVLRWQDRDANPPQRDLLEAATLAALHSKARTSKLVPVDYTRRKYVRKPRKSAPGRVTFERGKTVFVEPDRDAEERLRGENQ